MPRWAGARRVIPTAPDAATNWMAITPPSDIVLDTLMAADPLKSQAVADQLSRLRPSRAGDFDTALAAPASTPAAQGPQQASVAATTPTPRPAPRIDTAAIGRRAIPPAYRKFEAFVLQTFIEAMLPRGSAVNFGKGIAGDVWRSMLAEQLGTAVANAGGVGIAKALAKAHPGGTGSGHAAPHARRLMDPAGAQTIGTAVSEPARTAAAAMLDELTEKT